MFNTRRDNGLGKKHEVFINKEYINEKCEVKS